MVVKEIQELLKNENIDAYIIFNSDDHISEYIPDYYKEIKFITGYTGEGTLLILKDSAYIWVDGRYFIQADIELKNTDIKVMKMGEKNVPTISELLNQVFNEKITLAFDGKITPTNAINRIISKINIKEVIQKDLVSSLWNQRDPLPFSLLYILEQFYSGKSYTKKIDEVLKEIKNNNADMLILPELTSQAWLYNLRAGDISRTPVFLSYTVITEKQTTLFIDDKKINTVVEDYLKGFNIAIKPYDEIYQYLEKVNNQIIMIDLNHTNYELYNSILNRNTIIDTTSPIELMKSIKNVSEIKNTRKAQLKDCISLVKFMYNLKNNYEQGKSMTEYSISEDIYELRSKNKGFVDLSFDSIVAWNENAAMAHYTPVKSKSKKIEGPGFLLVDSGAHYLEGTTDITRTFALGKISNEMKKNFTYVLKAHINLAKAKFKKGTKGINLDILARQPLWEQGLDYNHGTGHGIGYLLSVHEGPNSFRYKETESKSEMTEIVPGMITSNEPGLYFENKYGIRIESDVLCVENIENENGEFYKFETLTYMPIDLDAIDETLLTQEEKDWLNDYHKKCYILLSPKLTEKQKEWLKEYTKRI